MLTRVRPPIAASEPDAGMLRLMDMRPLVIAALILAVAGGCGEGGQTAGGRAAGDTEVTPCADAGAGSSPFAGTGNEQLVAFPRDGGRVDVTVHIGDHLTVGWSGCNEHGQITTSPADNTGPLFSSDVSVYSSPRPTPPRPSGQPCCQRPVADGVFTVRYLAQMPGAQVLHGKGSAGSAGDIGVTVTPLSADEGRLVSGVVDTTALHSHPGPDVVYFQPSGVNPTQTITKPTSDGHFTTRLRPGSYTIMATSPAYNDGRAQCLLSKPIDVDRGDVTGIRIVCTERS
ncbi:MAG: hypothetical protein QOI82_2923 [Actinomycetota bacterium]|jgi:hypothetical protein|nr:hypothetical protein [Actinomycetota bacterium]